MKLIKHINKTFLVLVLSLFTLTLNAQKVKFETINISSSSLKIEDGNLVLRDKSTVLILETSFKLKGSDIEVPYVMIELRGKIKGKEQTFSTDVVSINKLEKIEQKLTINASNDNPIYISEVTISVFDKKKEIASATEAIFSMNDKKTNFAILLNGINAIDYCEYQDVNKVFYKESVSFGIFAVVIGLNNTKKEEPILLEKILTNGAGTLTGTYVWTEGNDKRTTKTVSANVDQNGNWFFKDSIKIGKDTPQLVGFHMEYITACKDSFLYKAIYAKEINKNKNYSKSYAMEGGPHQIYGDIGATGETYLTWRSKKAFNNSGIINNTGNVEIRENSEFTLEVGGIQIGGGNMKNKDQSNGKFGISSLSISLRTKAGKTISKEAKLNEKTNLYEATANIEGSEKTPVEISEIIITLVTDKKDTIIYEYEGKYGYSLDEKTLFTILKKTEKIKYYNPCNTKYKLKEIFTQEGTESNIYGLYLSFNFENNSDIPAKISMNVEITDCNKKTQYVELKLNYDSKSGLYYASQAITTSSNCKLEITAGTVTVLNECGEKTNWSFDSSQAKTLGNGGKCSSNKQCRMQVCKLG